MSSLKKLCVMGSVINIVVPLIIFALGVMSDSGGSSFGIIFIGFAICGAASFLYYLVLLIIYRTEIFKSTTILMLLSLMLAVNIWEMSLIKDFALWD